MPEPKQLIDLAVIIVLTGALRRYGRQIAEWLSGNLRGGGPRPPSHPLPGDDGVILRRRKRRVSHPLSEDRYYREPSGTLTTGSTCLGCREGMRPAVGFSDYPDPPSASSAWRRVSMSAGTRPAMNGKRSRFDLVFAGVGNHPLRRLRTLAIGNHPPCHVRWIADSSGCFRNRESRRDAESNTFCLDMVSLPHSADEPEMKQ